MIGKRYGDIAYTKRALELEFTHGALRRFVALPSGTRVLWTDMGPSGGAWTVDQPTRFADGDIILKHDLEHHYLCVPAGEGEVEYEKEVSS